MSLDQNLFTLSLVRNQDGTSIDLVDPEGNLHYRRRRTSPEHSFELYEPLSDSLLAAVLTTETNKRKTIELYNPTVQIELKYVGTMSFRWSFQWEDHTFEWKREECFLIRKPDPPVLVAITKEPPGRIRSTTVQILDYNINRFDVQDRKGLEIVLLSSLLSFQDPIDDPPPPEPPKPPATTRIPQALPNTPPQPSQLPPKDEDQIAIIQAKEAKDANDVVVGDIGEAADYAKLCVSLLKDPSILFISIRSKGSPATVPKVVAVADLTKRIIHREGLLPDIESLHQYVSYNPVGDNSLPIDAAKKKKKVINLDDIGDDPKHKGGRSHNDRDKEYKPPENLMIRLSKIDMPELNPKAKPSIRPVSLPSSNSGNKQNVDFKKKPSPVAGNKPTQNIFPSTGSGPIPSENKTSKPKPNQLQKPSRLSPAPASNKFQPSPVPPSSRPPPPLSTYAPPPSSPPNRPAPPPNSNSYPQSNGPPPSTWRPVSQGPPPSPQPPPPSSQNSNPSNAPSLGSLLGNAALQMLGNFTKR